MGIGIELECHHAVWQRLRGIAPSNTQLLDHTSTGTGTGTCRPAQGIMLEGSTQSSFRTCQASTREQGNELEAQPNRSDAQDHAAADIPRSSTEIAAANQRYGLQAESREGSEPTQQTREQKRPRIRAEPVIPLRETSEKAHDQAAKNIDCEGAKWKALLSGQVQEEAAQLVPGDRAYEAAEAD